MTTRLIALGDPLDIRRTLRPVRRGRDDPTFRFTPTGAVRAARSPEGTFTLDLKVTASGVEAEAWGDGADWALEHAPALLGQQDRAEGFDPKLHPLVARLARDLPGLRIGRTNAVVEAAVASICEQKVTSFEAHRAWSLMIARFGEPAPGPGGLLVAPDPSALAGAAYHDLHVMGLERRRADTIRRVCAQAVRLEGTGVAGTVELSSRLRAIAGVGAWTAAEVAAVALGDPDAVSVGDYHLPHLVSWALAGEPRGTDDRMLELLEPFRGHRGRVVRLIEAGTKPPPRRGPRLAPRSIARI